VFAYLVSADRPVDVAELTAHVGLHHNAVRQHLDKLVAAGLVIEAAAPPTGPGRPRLEYRVDPRADARWGARNPYERLSAILADALGTGSTPVDAGRRAGSASATERLDGGGAGRSDPVALVADVMARHGFEPEVRPRGDGADLVLHTCPYAAAALADPDVVCAVHRGIAEGVAAAAGDALVVAGLDVVDPRAGGCRLRLRSAMMRR
jgi:predicted ArsR family transcriptional regulator